MPEFTDEQAVRAKAMCVFESNDDFCYSRSGPFLNIDKDMWEKGIDRIIETERFASSNNESSMDGFALNHSWILPLMAIAESGVVDIGPIVDVGCGNSIPIWDAIRNGNEQVIGFNIDAINDDDKTRVRCQVMDLDSLREKLSQYLSHRGGLLVSTEFLEHLPYNPLPPFLMLSERISPRHIYITAPSIYAGPYMSDWKHYSSLPSYRGERFKRGTWHYKPWVPDELMEFVEELGFSIQGHWTGFYRSGILGVNNEANQEQG